MDVKYPSVTVKLSGQDGNAFNIMGLVTHALQRAGVTEEEIEAYSNEAMSGDYDNLIRVSMQWVNTT